MSKTAVNRLARYRVLQKLRRERRLELARKKIEKFRSEHPLPQGQLDLRDEYLSRRQHLERVAREVFNDAAR